MATSIWYTIQDGKGDESTVTLNVTDFGTGSIADLPQLMADFLPLIKALTDGGLVRSGFTFELDPAVMSLVWSSVATATADTQEKGFFGWITTAGKDSHFTIPAFKETFIVAGSRAINAAATQIAALITAIEDGFVSDGITFRFGDSNGEDYVAARVLREAWGKYRRGN